MLQMNQIDQIKELQRQGLGPQKIAQRLNLDRKTVAKYMRIEDFNGGEWIKKETVSKLDSWKPKIDEWLEEDRRMRFKLINVKIKFPSTTFKIPVFSPLGVPTLAASALLQDIRPEVPQLHALRLASAAISIPE
jgi:hypothetical protein